MILTFCFFFFNDTATTEIYTLSLHDALPISRCPIREHDRARGCEPAATFGGSVHEPGKHGGRPGPALGPGDRKSTRLNSSHANISYAVFCLKKKKKIQNTSDTISINNYT